MGMKTRAPQKDSLASELSELLDEVVDVIRDENEEAAIRLTGYLDFLQRKTCDSSGIDVAMRGAYQEGVNAAKSIRG